MRDRHWGLLSSKLGFTIRPNTDLTLSNLLDMDFLGKMDALADVNSVATREYALEKQLETMINEWEHLELEISSYR